MTRGELLRMTEEITGLAMPNIRVPYRVALMAGVTSEFLADFVTHRQPKAPLTDVRLARYPMYFGSEKSVKALKLPQHSVYQALVDEIDWLDSNRLITRRLPIRQSIWSGAVF